MTNQHSNESNYYTPEYANATEFNLFLKVEAYSSTSCKIAFIGNSITLHGPSSNICWEKNNGMAASCIKNDYCHQLLDLLNEEACNAYVGNFAEIERLDIKTIPAIKVINKLIQDCKPQILIIQLGDNASNTAELNFFIKNLDYIASIAKQNCQTILILSTWRESKVKDKAIKYIADIY